MDNSMDLWCAGWQVNLTFKKFLTMDNKKQKSKSQPHPHFHSLIYFLSNYKQCAPSCSSASAHDYMIQRLFIYF